MKKTLSILSLFLLSLTTVSAQDCDLPSAFEGNTGANMTVMLLPDLINSLDVASSDAYLVALNANGSVVGSEEVAGITQTTITIWGDDSSTPESDGALAGEAISFQLVDGALLSEVTMPNNVSYATNGMVIQPTAAALSLICEPAPSCSPSAFEGNTGANMTVMLTPGFISSLNVSASDAYLVALSTDGSVVGSEVVAGISQTALSVWGDDSSTDETDGALAGEAISFQLVDGELLFDVVMPTPVSYSTNSMLPQLAAGVLTEASCGGDDGDVSGCTNPSAFNYNANATTDDGSCTAVVNGCKDASAFNYDANANTDDGSCIAVANGCTNPLAFNFDSLANTDDASCQAVALGCTDESAFNYDSAANTDDDSCISVVLGCTNPLAFNFDAAANSDDGSCTAVALGCTDASSFNYDPAANTDDNSCIAVVLGCINPLAFNFDASANVDDNSCQAIIGGCMNPLAANYNEDVNTQIEGACIEVVYGCTYDYAFVTNFNALATVNLTSADDSTDPCIYDFGTRMATSVCIDPLAENYLPVADASSDVFNSVVASNVTIDNTVCEFIEGCTDGLAINYNYLAVVDDNSCEAVALGCTDASSFNYDPAANTDNNSCIAIVSGCTDALAFNFDVSANTDDSSCEAVALGCTDASAFNFDATANTTNNSCVAVSEGCTDALAFNYDASANTDDSSCEAIALGCTDATAFNFDNSANTDDSSCDAVVNGCTDALAFNYDDSANTDDSSCEAVALGCTDALAFNYDASANTDDASCEAIVEGCTDSLAFNYDASANTNSGCEAVVNGCTDAAAFNFDADANTDDDSCVDAVLGCTDEEANNYNDAANSDDESCTYDSSGEAISYELSAGWNMVGYTGTADNNGIVAQMDAALGNDAGTAGTFQVIKNVSGQFWSAAFAQISDFTQGEGYMMFVNGTPTSVNFQKESGYISGIEYSLSAGWNMVAFTGDVNSESNIVTAMDAALENGAGTANTFQVIKNVSGQFWSAAFAQISSFTPGEAYMMFVNGAATSVNFQRE